MIEISQISPQDLEKKLRPVMATLPYKIGEQVIKFSMNRFSEGNWVNNATEPWQRRKQGAKRNLGRALLVDTGRLRRSVRVMSASSDWVRIGSDVPYAGAHNDGFTGTVNVKAHTRASYKKSQVEYTTKAGKTRKKTVQSIAGKYNVKAHTRRMNMPRRRFLGESYYQTQQIRRMIEAEIRRAFR